METQTDFIDDEEQLMAEVVRDGTMLGKGSLRLRSDKEFVLAALRSCKSPWVLSHASPELRDDKEVVLAAVKKNGFSVSSASERLRGDRTVALAAASNSRPAYSYLSDAMRADREVAKVAAECGAPVLRFATEELRSDRELVLLAVSHNFESLGFASDEFRNDREIVMAATMLDGRAWQFASTEFRNDKEALLGAVRISKWPLRFTSRDLRSDPEVVLAAAQHDGAALEFASRGLRADRALALEILDACSNFAEAFPFLGEELQSDLDFLLAVARKDESILENLRVDQTVKSRVAGAAASKIAQKGDTGAPVVVMEAAVTDSKIESAATFASGRCLELSIDASASVADIANLLLEKKPEEMQFDRVFLVVKDASPVEREEPDDETVLTPWDFDRPLVSFLKASQ